MKQRTAMHVTALNAEGGATPEWVGLLPTGPQISGRDDYGMDERIDAAAKLYGK